MDDSCPVLLKRAQSFWGKSRKCEKKITQGQTDAQQNINRKARSLVGKGVRGHVNCPSETAVWQRTLKKKKSSNISKCIKFKTNSDHFDKNIFFIRTYKRNLKKYLHVYE